MAKRIDRAEFRQLFEAGMNRADLANHFGCDLVTVTRIRKALNLPEFAGTPRRLTTDRRQRIQAMLADGQSFAEISRTEGADPETLRRHFPGQQWTRRQCIDFHTAIRRIKEGPRRAGRAVAYEQKERAA